MSAPASALPEEVTWLIEQKDFEALEDVWTAKMEKAASDLPFFFAVAFAVKKKGGGTQAVSWLRFLADYLGEGADGGARMDVLLEIARMSPTDESIRSDLEKALRERFASHPALAAVLAHFPLEKAADPADTGGRVARWLNFRPGDIHWMPGRGPGRIVELNPTLDVIRLEVSGTRVPLSLVSAEKSLTLLPPEHFLRFKVEDPEGARALAEKDPAETVRRLIQSFGGSLTAAEIKEHLAGVVEEARWTAFWSAARKHPQLLVSGASKTAAVSWSESAGAADESHRRAFEEADPSHKLDLARRNAKRSKELARFYAEGLAAAAREAAAAAKPGLAWELSQAAARILPGEKEVFPAAELMASGDPLDLLSEIRDHTPREQALEAIRKSRSDWPEVFAEQMLREEDVRVLAAIFDGLGEQPERRDEMTRKILRSPRLAPRAFLWLAERMHGGGGVLPASVFFALLHALRQDEFSSVRARLKELFEPGNLAVSLVRAAASEEEAREMLFALDRAGGLEDHRRGVVREALLMKFPELRAPAREYLYATAEAIEARRKELLHLKQVELPANAQAMRTAMEHGDLSENFEYHAARQRHEYLSARVAALSDELSRSRALDPARVDASEVRVGTRVTLRDAATGAERAATILGPWDSRPEEAIYSYQSEFAQALLGKTPGEHVTLPDGEAVVAAIEPWR